MTSCPDTRGLCPEAADTVGHTPGPWPRGSQLRGAAGLPRGFLTQWLPQALLATMCAKMNSPVPGAVTVNDGFPQGLRRDCAFVKRTRLTHCQDDLLKKAASCALCQQSSLSECDGRTTYGPWSGHSPVGGGANPLHSFQIPDSRESQHRCSVPAGLTHTLGEKETDRGLMGGRAFPTVG